jgi:Multimeric flavodoxin WrbA
MDELGPKAAVFSCTHKAQGNSNDAAHLFVRGVEAAGGQADTIYLRKIKILPCTACGICEKDTESPCILAEKDYAAEMFDLLMTAPFAFFSSPIYFYHLPSIFKTWIDRSQQVWAAKHKGDPKVVGLPRRPAYVCLLAGRREGEKLFDGALLTLKYFLDSFNLEIRDPMTLKGVDKVGDLEKDEAATEALFNLGKTAWERYAAEAKKD